MAKIFPSIFPYDLDGPEMQKLGIQVEYEVYNQLKKLSDNFEIFCGPKFLKKNIHGDMRDGEYSDFIIIHKKKGILFLECKGGVISFNPIEGKWYQNKKVLKKSPLKQANDGKLNLINLLKSDKYKKDINTRVGGKKFINEWLNSLHPISAKNLLTPFFLNLIHFS